MGNNKNNEKNDYLNKIDGRIDKLMWVFCKNLCKIEKVGFFCKIDRNFALTAAVALRVQKRKNLIYS